MNEQLKEQVNISEMKHILEIIKTIIDALLKILPFSKWQLVSVDEMEFLLCFMWRWRDHAEASL